MHVKTRILVPTIGILLLVTILLGMLFYMHLKVDYSSIDHIKELQKSPNEFNDLSGDIDVHSYEDLGFIVNSRYNISIYYGRQIIEMNPSCFKSEEYRERLCEIGIKVYTRVSEETGNVEYKVTYWGDEIDQFTRVD